MPVATGRIASETRGSRVHRRRLQRPGRVVARLRPSIKRRQREASYRKTVRQPARPILESAGWNSTATPAASAAAPAPTTARRPFRRGVASHAAPLSGCAVATAAAFAARDADLAAAAPRRRMFLNAARAAAKRVGPRPPSRATSAHCRTPARRWPAGPSLFPILARARWANRNAGWTVLPDQLENRGPQGVAISSVPGCRDRLTARARSLRITLDDASQPCLPGRYSSA